MAQPLTPPPPAQTPAPSSDRNVEISQAILLDIFGPPAGRAFAVRFWDGTTEQPDQEPRFTFALQRPGALRRMFLRPSDLSIGEAYLRGDFDLEGDIETATHLGLDTAERLKSARVLARLAQRLLQLPTNDAPSGPIDPRRPPPALRGRKHSRERDAEAVRYHYDVGNDFYALWLDARMVYSCGYFTTPDQTLDAAQTAKLEHLCRKLRLKRGERLLDIGCGWGGLVLYAAEHYGVEALGVTLSAPQATLARERIAAAGLQDRCRVEVQDYREVAPAQPFDKVVSVGMFEHVGPDKLPEYFAAAYRLTKPGGLFLNHGIASPASSSLVPRSSWFGRGLGTLGSFNQRYVFPDGDLVPPATAVQQAEAAGFETRDVESLREHYTLTLRQWVRRLEAQHEQAADLAGEATYRVWRLYMAASAAGFDSGKYTLIQALFSKPDAAGHSEIPMTRADLYLPEKP